MAKAQHDDAAEAGHEGRGGAGAERDDVPVDVLVVTALQDELEGVLAQGEGGAEGWRALRDLGGFRYYRRTFPGAQGGSIAVAAAWIGEAGERTAAIRGQQLLTELDPACLAMCGICAGDPGKVALGDVIVADRLYSFDQGKRVAPPGKEAELLHDVRTFDLAATWKMDAAFLARELDLAALSRERPPSREAQQRWLVDALHAHEAEGGPAPVAHPDRRRACPGWTARLKEAVREGLAAMKGGALRLTDAGRERALEERLLHPDGPPADPPLRVHVGAIATFTAVMQDPGVWGDLQRVVRGTLGLDMEGAAIGDLAARFQKRSIFIKAVSDHADLAKDDGFRAFACRASAAVLLVFLQKHLEPAPRRERDLSGRRAMAEDPTGGVKLRPEDGGRAFEDRHDGFLQRIERVALLRAPGATVTRHRAPPPFAGVLEVAARDGSLVDMRVIGALDQPITEELVARYVTDVERRFRQQDPLLRSTLIHAGPQAPPELAQRAWRRGVALKSFSEYQGLIDFDRYLARQTERLEADPIYPPWLYVDQPAVVSLGDREKSATESAIASLWELLDAPRRRFVLVLGDFGAGKTFLLHELARRMARDKHPLVPVLIEMSRLEKQRSLSVLVAQHFALADEPVDPRAFSYMLAEGRIALLFDGFDELALRLTYDRVLEHFETVVQAAEGVAKVVVTSRTQHFLDDRQIKQELARRAEQVQGYRLVQLQGFGEKQIRRFLGNMIPEPAEAEARYRLLHEVKDLLGLSENPRMLGFIAKIEEKKLLEAKEGTGEITAAKLYELLVEQWLDHEHRRANPPGAPRGISRGALRGAMTEVARLLWDRRVRAVGIGELPDSLVKGVQPPDGPPLERAMIEFLIGSGSLLVRDAEGAFSFVHRSVLEWLVAEAAAREVSGAGDSAALAADEMSELMVDFFVSLAGRQEAAAWAARVLHGAAEGHAKDNGLRIARWLARGEEDAEAGEDETVEVEGINLAGQDLSGQNLNHADLRRANLVKANLTNATLVEAKLAGASLVSARLSRADLRDASLTGADLRGADLSFARLVGADLTGADLEGAALRGAKLVGARGGTVAPIAAEGAAPPRPSGADLIWMLTSACNAVAWSPRGDLLATGHDDGSVRLWDAFSGQAIRGMAGHLGPVNSVAFSADGRTLASGADDRTVRLWEVTSGRALRVLDGHGRRVLTVVLSADGRTLASGSADRTARLWEVTSGRVLRTFEGHGAWVMSVVLSPDGRTLASGSYDTTVRLWEVESGRALRVFEDHDFEGHDGAVMSVVFSPDGRTLASASYDKTVRLWEVESGRALRVFKGHFATATSVAFSPDGRTLASGSYDKTVRLWEVESGRALNVFDDHSAEVTSVVFSVDGQTLASGSVDRTARLWEVESGRVLRVLEGHGARVMMVAFSADGRTLASGSDDRLVRLWEVESGRVLRAFESHGDWVRSVVFSPDGRRLASGSGDSTVRLWEVESGRALRVFEGAGSGMMSVAFSPDGQTLASGAGDGTVWWWKVGRRRALRVLEGHGGGVMSVAFSPDGRTLASGSVDKTVRLWEVEGGQAVRVFEGHGGGVMSVAFSPDSRMLASGSGDRTVRLWSVESGRVLRVLEGHANWARSVAFSPDGRLLASGSDDSRVRLWDVPSGRALRALDGHKALVSSVAFSPDGALLASASSDGTLRLWRVATGLCLAILLPCPEGWAAFTPDGRYRFGGDIAGSFWHVIGLCRFEPGELDPYLPSLLHLPDGEPLIALPPAGTPPANGVAPAEDA
ncbi:pentapeptide repeat-containing protein [Sorangium sp. So ce1389]|uniref:pentapeptide repeat-containing protein n=1 Tax=Sorangium sp. So ce1389 TaxID=3133336 RepID=UPI003F61C9C6